VARFPVLTVAPLLSFPLRLLFAVCLDCSDGENEERFTRYFLLARFFSHFRVGRVEIYF
jgi:hypothetical protein